MVDQEERILVVESDPMVSDLIARQALTPQGFNVKIVSEASSAIQQAVEFAPDVVIANLELPGLSGKDLMVALSAQQIDIPVIMIAPEGKERDVIQAFRLGASDYVGSPVRETEVVSAVERALKQVRARSERERLSRKVQATNEQLQKRVRELTTIFSIGKAVTSVTGQDKLFNTIVEGAVSITEADYGWLLVFDEREDVYILRAFINLPKSLAANLNKAWDDGISSLVARSGEAFSIHGEAIEQFQMSALGKAALIVPVKVKRQTIATLAVMRKDPNEFEPSDQAMLEAVSDYASISLVNVRLFQAIDERAGTLQAAVERAMVSERAKEEIIQNVGIELHEPLVSTKDYVEKLVKGELGKLSNEQVAVLEILDQKLHRVVEIVNVMTMMHEVTSPKELAEVSVNNLVNQALSRFKNFSAQNRTKLTAVLPSEPVLAYVDANQIALVFDALLSNAIKFSPKNGEVVVTVKGDPEEQVHVSVKDEGQGIAKKNLKRVFDYFYKIDGQTNDEVGGLGVGLTLVKEIVNAHGGEVWVESKLEAGSTFHFTLLPKEAV
ncbi:MAG: response regulator [Chloroflexi bacterium]|nr:response regulator [Chloroflexota bacterium]